jgi:hypothetical protein
MSVYRQRAVVIDGVVDALGVIVGLTRLHLPAEQGTTNPSRCASATAASPARIRPS